MHVSYNCRKADTGASAAQGGAEVLRLHALQARPCGMRRRQLFGAASRAGQLPLAACCACCPCAACLRAHNSADAAAQLRVPPDHAPGPPVNNRRMCNAWCRQLLLGRPAAPLDAHADTWALLAALTTASRVEEQAGGFQPLPQPSQQPMSQCAGSCRCRRRRAGGGAAASRVRANPRLGAPSSDPCLPMEWKKEAHDLSTLLGLER